MREVIATTNAPSAIGPYSQAIRVSGTKMLFVSGQLGMDTKTGSLISENVADQTTQALENLNGILDASGFKKADIVKTTIFLKDMNAFALVNEIYAKYFDQNPPARSTIEVSRLPKNAQVEIEAIAVQ